MSYDPSIFNDKYTILEQLEAVKHYLETTNWASVNEVSKPLLITMSDAKGMGASAGLQVELKLKNNKIIYIGDSFPASSGLEDYNRSFLLDIKQIGDEPQFAFIRSENGNGSNNYYNFGYANGAVSGWNEIIQGATIRIPDNATTLHISAGY